jgi:uncharacterized protein
MRGKRFGCTIILIVLVAAALFFTSAGLLGNSQAGLSGYLERAGIGFSGDITNDSPVEKIPVEELTVPDLTVLGARAEVKSRVRYDASYISIDYPMGDVPANIGVCTDVVIRAYRNAGIDLQRLIHEDMLENFELYPQAYGLSAPDSNIDHRRVRNQMRFFERFGETLTLQVDGSLDEWRWGDIVYWRFPDGQLHAGIVSDRKNRAGIPLIIHNSWLAVEEDALQRWEIIGHFRFDG